jgi:spore coat polysaccharide biosynthesis protein SpsF
MPDKIVCIIQARRRSSRLPDKILKPLGGRPVLAHVIGRCQAVKSVGKVICAGIDDPYEDPIFTVARAAGASCFKGSETDVLSRYYQAAKAAGATWVMRVTSDCPLFDPDVAETLIAGTLASGHAFGANANWPHGLDCELFTFDLLEQAHKAATSALDREHVTLWMKHQPSLKMHHHRPPEGQLLNSRYRWVLDYPEDYQFLVEVFAKLGDKAEGARWLDIIALLQSAPDIAAINHARSQDWARENARIHTV